MDETNNESLLSISPRRLFYGIVSSGFIYNLTFSIKNNLLIPLRVRIVLIPKNGELNSIELKTIPEIISPGLSINISLELCADFVYNSLFDLHIYQSSSDEIIKKIVEANIVNPETFKQVRKSLQLQNRSIYRSNITVVGSSLGQFEEKSLSTLKSSNPDVFLDEDDIEDMQDLPMTPNIFWDPFHKILRLDPQLGKVFFFIINNSICYMFSKT
jgi:hypothetical protein